MATGKTFERDLLRQYSGWSCVSGESDAQEQEDKHIRDAFDVQQRRFLGVLHAGWYKDHGQNHII